MADQTFDVVLLGVGSGNALLATRLLDAGLGVLAVEANRYGGECPHWACIPSKAALRAADALAEGRRIDELAGRAEVRPDWSVTARRIDEVTHHRDDSEAVAAFEKRGGVIVRGRGTIVGRGRVAVDGTTYVAERAVVLNTGTRPTIPALPGLDGTPYWTTTEATEAHALPASIVVLGGGPVGVEQAQILARFGVRTALVEAAERLLPGDEPEAGERLADVLRHDDVDVRTSTEVESVSHDGARFELRTRAGTLAAEGLLVAVGRTPNTADLGFEHYDVTPDEGGMVPVDERLRVAPGLFAIGDITGKGAYTHVANYQAEIAVDTILEHSGAMAADYRAVPHVTFVDPEVAAVGLTEAAARDAGIAVVTGFVDAADTTRGWLTGPGGAGFIKLVVDPSRDVLVGATVMGPAAGEAIGLLTLAVQAATPLDLLRRTMFAFPTYHRSVQNAIDALRP